MSQETKFIKDLMKKETVTGDESLLIQDDTGTKQTPLSVIVDKVVEESTVGVAEAIDSFKESANQQIENNQQQIDTFIEETQLRADEALADVDQINQKIAQTNAQLSQTDNNIEKIFINATMPPKPFNPIKEGIDNTNFLQALIDNFDNVVVPKGEYIINGTIKMTKNTNGTLKLMDGAKLIKKKNSDNVLPVVQLRGYGQSIIGENKWGCQIISEKDSPYGVVSLGYDNMCDSVGTMICYCNINNINICGRGTDDNGVENIGLYMCNPEVNNKPSYFHTINELIIRYCNTGLMLEGFANGNVIKDIQFIYCGTNRYYDGGAIKLKETDGKYPLENSITNVMQGGLSAGAYTLVFDGQSLGNIISIISEPGGTTGNEAIFAKILGGNQRNNIITCYANTRGGEGWTDEFLMNNTVITGKSIFNYSIGTNNLTVKNELNIKGFTKPYNRNFDIKNTTPLAEGEKVEVLIFPFNGYNRNRSCLVTITYSVFSESDLGRKRFVTGESKIEVYQGLTGEASGIVLWNTESPIDTANPNLISTESNKIFLTMPTNTGTTMKGHFIATIDIKGYDFKGVEFGNKINVI